MVDKARYAFKLSAWNDLAGVDDTFVLLYFITNKGTTEIEINDPKHKKKFLSRIAYPQLKLDDVRPGGRVMIYSRQYKVESYEDAFTKEALGKAQQGAFCLLTEPGIGAIGRVWSAAEASGLRVVAARMVNLSNEDADIVSGGVGGNVSAGAVLALNMMGDDAASKTQALTSHVHERAGTPRNSLLAAVDEGANAALTNGFFGDAKQRLKSARELSGTFADCACALVLPGALSGGQAGSILTEIQDRIAGTDIKISALRSVALTRSQAEEFYEVYKAVVPEYVEMVNELSRGPLLALEVTGPGAVLLLRELAGPRDIEVAKRVRPSTLRAKYGVSVGACAIHVTDLPEDGPLECEYMFALVQG